MGRMLVKSLDAPDQRIDMEWLFADAVQLAGTSIARTEMKPGPRCLIALGAMSCPVHHADSMVSSQMRVRSANGAIIDFGPTDALDLEPGRDGRTVDDQPVVLVN
jgi:hypothetical protein